MITTEEAIEQLELYEHAADSISREDFIDACNLGANALRRHKDRYKYTFSGMMSPLPGEDVIDMPNTRRSHR